MRAFIIMLTVAYSVANPQFGLPKLGVPKVAQRVGDVATSGVSSVADAGGQIASSLFEGQWQEFLKGKNYSPSELLSRKNIFLTNAQTIADAAKSGVVGFAMKLNSLADLTFDEFNKFFNGFRGSAIGSSKAPVYKTEKEEPLPESVDYREKGAVTPVQNQLKCAGCWAFAAAGALEGHHFLKTGQLEQISVQNLLDCSKENDNGGCNGGLVEPAFDYIQDNGINRAANYEFVAKNGECKHAKAENAANCTGYVRVPQGDEKSLAKALAQKGPISVALHVVPRFQLYSDGVFYDPDCKNSPGDLNHAVLLVGYGKEPNGQKYWLVKNSYGADWGKEGYVKIAKDAGNHCGIATYARFPTV
ncbi:hypothetical protein NQ317_007463 [Molorchus minor]|uniref:Uncharacterized protein n=1 Tax=Molorchus minor TaxID=1323400 RepID=A0ABQ9K0Z5_9CUCU|nr:hypothetical protein NQ317_007463 [Molorchus minor]